MNLPHERIAHLCEQFKFSRLAAQWPALAIGLVAGFSRYHKHTLGTEMREGSRAVLMQVLKANNAANAGARRCCRPRQDCGPYFSWMHTHDRSPVAIGGRSPCC